MLAVSAFYPVVLCISQGSLPIVTSSERLTFTYHIINLGGKINICIEILLTIAIVSLLTLPVSSCAKIKLNLHIRGAPLTLMVCKVWLSSPKPPFRTIYARHHASPVFILNTIMEVISCPVKYFAFH